MVLKEVMASLLRQMSCLWSCNTKWFVDQTPKIVPGKNISFPIRGTYISCVETQKSMKYKYEFPCVWLKTTFQLVDWHTSSMSITCDNFGIFSLQEIHVKQTNQRQNVAAIQTKTSWWLNQPIWKICSSNWIISPGIGVKIKNISNHHLNPFSKWFCCWLVCWFS